MSSEFVKENYRSDDDDDDNYRRFCKKEKQIHMVLLCEFDSVSIKSMRHLERKDLS